eukprot:9994270-Alexandrium_andersonii.AAC.1
MSTRGPFGPRLRPAGLPAPAPLRPWCIQVPLSGPRVGGARASSNSRPSVALCTFDDAGSCPEL